MPALVNIEIPGLPGVAQRAVRAVFNGYARRIFGPQLCAATGIPDIPVRHLIPLDNALIRPFEVARCQLRVVDRAAHSGADRMWRRLMPLVLSDRADYGWSHVDKIVEH